MHVYILCARVHAQDKYVYKCADNRPKRLTVRVVCATQQICFLVSHLCILPVFLRNYPKPNLSTCVCLQAINAVLSTRLASILITSNSSTYQHASIYAIHTGGARRQCGARESDRQYARRRSGGRLSGHHGWFMGSSISVSTVPSLLFGLNENLFISRF